VGLTAPSGPAEAHGPDPRPSAWADRNGLAGRRHDRTYGVNGPSAEVGFGLKGRFGQPRPKAWEQMPDRGLRPERPLRSAQAEGLGRRRRTKTKDEGRRTTRGEMGVTETPWGTRLAGAYFGRQAASVGLSVHGPVPVSRGGIWHQTKSRGSRPRRSLAALGYRLTSDCSGIMGNRTIGTTTRCCSIVRRTQAWRNLCKNKEHQSRQSAAQQ
jgi:ribosomal protein L36